MQILIQNKSQHFLCSPCIYFTEFVSLFPYFTCTLIFFYVKSNNKIVTCYCVCTVSYTANFDILQVYQY